MMINIFLKNVSTKVLAGLGLAGCIAILFCQQSLAQYKGEPVEKDRLVKVLRSKQLQTSDVVAVINSNGVDFKLDSKTERELVEAGARPEVLSAVRGHYRSGNKKSKNNDDNSYDGLLNKSIDSGGGSQSIASLERAIKLNPNDSRAYQLLGHRYLYNLRDYKQAEFYMQKAISLGGAAVLRVQHAHDVTFTYKCAGSLYISRNSVRFESDDASQHTFNVSKSNITKIETINPFKRLLSRKRGMFKIVINDKKEPGDTDKYSFSPLTETDDEAKLIVRLVGKN